MFADSDINWGEEGSYPGEDWAKGVGGAISAFSEALKVQSDSGGWFSSDVDMGEFILKITTAIILAGQLFSKYGVGLWQEGSYPTNDWADNVGGVLSNISNLEFDIKDIKELYNSSKYLFWSARWLSKMKYYPMEDGVENFTNAISQIINVLPDENAVDPLLKLVDAFKELGNISWADMWMISNVSDAIEDISESLDNLHADKVDSLLKLGAGFQLISLVDEKQLEKVLETLDEKTEVLKNVTDDGGYMRNMLDDMFNGFSKSKENSKNNDSKSKKTNGAIVYKFNPYEERMLDAVEYIAENVEELKNKEKIEIETEQESRNV